MNDYEFKHVVYIHTIRTADGRWLTRGNTTEDEWKDHVDAVLAGGQKIYP